MFKSLAVSYKIKQISNERWHMPLFPALRNKGRQISMSSRLAWSTVWVLGQSEIHSETLSLEKSFKLKVKHILTTGPKNVYPKNFYQRSLKGFHRKANKWAHTPALSLTVKIWMRPRHPSADEWRESRCHWDVLHQLGGENIMSKHWSTIEQFKKWALKTPMWDQSYHLCDPNYMTLQKRQKLQRQ